MAKSKPTQVNEKPELLERIKELAIIGMFSDDTLMDALVLKGGNALDLIYKISLRASVDVDFSMKGDFPGGAPALREKIDASLRRTFGEAGFQVFDLKVDEQPEKLSEDMKSFWGGYSIEFKLIESNRFKELSKDLDALRRYAINLGKGPKFLIDISRFEFLDGGEQRELQGYAIRVYSPAMIVAEKLRALCQQMAEYGPIVKRTRPGSSRARDFVDIHRVIETFNVDMTTAENRGLLSSVFKAKHVPLAFLANLGDYRSFHAASFPAVKDTLRPGITLEGFDFYFDFVLGLVGKLQPFGNE